MSDSLRPHGLEPPGSSVHGIFQARILDWAANSFSRDLSDTGLKPTSPVLAGGFFTTESPGEPAPVALEGGVLTTGSPGKSLTQVFILEHSGYSFRN